MSLLMLLSFQVTRVFCYLTIVTLQYMVPVLLILFSTLALKALGKTCTVPSMATTSFEGTFFLFITFSYIQIILTLIIHTSYLFIYWILHISHSNIYCCAYHS